MFDIIIEQNVENVKPQYMGVLENPDHKRERSPQHRRGYIGVVGIAFLFCTRLREKHLAERSAQIDSLNILADDLRKQLVLFVRQRSALFFYGAVIAFRRPVKEDAVA